jgi:hypothetical protein
MISWWNRIQARYCKDEASDPDRLPACDEWPHCFLSRGD